MQVGWLADSPGYIGGAELTQAEFRATAPVEVIDCPPGKVVKGLDRYLIFNCVSYTTADLEPMGDAPIIRYINDTWPAGDPMLRRHLLKHAHLIFTSPLHIARFPHRVESQATDLVPPALDLDRFRVETNGHREGNVCIGRMAYGKGLDLLAEYEGQVDLYSSVPVESRGSLTFKGSVDWFDVPKVLARYKRFVFLPTALEPFGRAVVEAWAAGCELILNRNVGARWWIEEKPEALKTASERFWEVVLS